MLDVKQYYVIMYYKILISPNCIEVIRQEWCSSWIHTDKLYEMTEHFPHHAAVLLWEWSEAVFALGGATTEF